MILAVDTETTGADFWHGCRPYLVTTCDDAGVVRYWEWAVDPRTRRPDVPPEDVREIRELLDAADRLVGQNIKFDSHALATVGVPFGPADWAKTDDTIVAGHALSSNTPHNLTAMAAQYLDEDVEPFEAALERACKAARDWARRNRPAWRIARADDPALPGARNETWKIDAWLPRAAAADQGWPAPRPDCPVAEDRPGHHRAGLAHRWGTDDRCAGCGGHAWWAVTAEYANADSGVTLKLWAAMRRLLADRRLERVFRAEMELVPVLAGMEARGATVHAGRMAAIRARYAADADRIAAEMRDIAAAEGWDLRLPKAGNNRSLTDFCFGWAEVRCDVCRGAVRVPRDQVARNRELEAARTPCRRCAAAGVARGGFPKVREYPLLDLPVVATTETGAPSLDSKTAIPTWLATLDPDGVQHRFVELLAAKRKKDTALGYLAQYERFMVPADGSAPAARAPAGPAAPAPRPAATVAPPRRAAAFGVPAGAAVAAPARDPAAAPWHVLHSNLNQTATDTLRLSSSNPNSQNVGADADEDGVSLREVFGPGPGREWWAVDYENIELRIPAYVAREPELIALFERADEPPYYGSEHLLNFSTVYPDLWAEALAAAGPAGAGEHVKTKLKKWYKRCKGGDFASGYGAVLKADGWGTADRAFGRQGSHAKLVARFAKKEKLNQEKVAMANRFGFVETLPDAAVDPARGYPINCTVAEWGRISPTVPLNYFVQSTACWVARRALVKCERELARWRAAGFAAWMVLYVHDEIVFDLPAGGRANLPRVRRLVRLMESCGDDVGVPLRAAARHCPDTWARGEEMR